MKVIHKSIDAIASTKVGKTKVGNEIVKRLRDYASKGKMFKADLRGAPGKINSNPGRYMTKEDIIVLNDDYLKTANTEFIATLGHEGLHILQFEKDPKREYVQELEIEAFTFESALKSELRPELYIMSKPERKMNVDLSYRSIGVEKQGKGFQSIEGFSEVEDIVRDAYKRQQQNAKPFSSGSSNLGNLWTFPNGDVRVEKVKDTAPNESDPVVDKNPAVKETWD